MTQLLKKESIELSISLPHRVTRVDLVDLDMLEFDVILGIDWLHSCFTSIDCRFRGVKFQFPDEPVLDGKGEIQFIEVETFLFLRLVNDF